jgi:WXG100 family type VII secretion target
MAMIRMDVDQAEATIGSFGTAIGNLNSELSTLASAVQALLGAWEGSAQVQFDNAWFDWSSRFQTAIQELEPMMSGLRAEREQIIEADASSNFA